MSEWKEAISGEVLDLISGYAFKSKDFKEVPDEDDLPVIKIKNVANGDVNFENVVYHEVSEKLEKYILEKGDILIAMTGNHPHAMTQVVGDVSRYKLAKKGLLNQRVGKLVAKDDNCLEFFYYYFKDEDNRNYLANQSSGSANQANISKGDILGIPMIIPEPEEQNAIAEVLSSLDDKIDLLHRQNQTLEQIAETLFRHWFVEDEKDNWEVVLFEDFVKHVKPGTNYQPKRVDFGIPFLNVRCFDNGFVNTSNSTYITQSEYERVHSKWVPEANDVLISRIGTLGLVAVITEKDLPIAVHYNMINLKAKMSSYQFLYFLLKSKWFQEEYLTKARQSVQAYLAIDDVKSIELKLPIGTDEFIAKQEIFNSLFDKIKSNQNQIHTITAQRDTLLPKLMSGEVRVQENPKNASL